MRESGDEILGSRARGCGSRLVRVDRARVRSVQGSQFGLQLLNVPDEGEREGELGKATGQRWDGMK